MKIQIEVQLFANGANFLQSGSCSVITTDFRKEPEWTAAVSAYEWIQKIKNTVLSLMSDVIEFGKSLNKNIQL
ncbi:MULTISPECIES: hypothetical protein [Peribacillus]|uniref:hypothetical protein n=1 Tax=Peribacillus TaxID=2675229 RepID=UPI001F4EB044|nr:MULTISPECIES: hypothetical protein [unclassified Peribacillus]MCK1981981.1 hypothetical protein [Peribacillus sp. Aquil_B1]MCK2007667.1 hypothetical protein [Peribacillus sp. Aquil_B8]